MSKKRLYRIAREINPEEMNYFSLVFDEKKKAWLVEHFSSSPENRSGGTQTYTLEEFGKTAHGKRLADQLQAAIVKAQNDA